MTLRIKLRHLVIGVVAGALLAGAGYALAATRSTVIHGCVNSKTRALTVPANGRCVKGSKALSWNQLGPRGKTGSRGKTGTAGTPATVSVGAVTTEAAGSQATVTNSGTASRAVLNFGIPQGAAGQNGTNAASSGPTAYGEVWMNDDTSQDALAPGSNNANVQTATSGSGQAFVEVTGCSTAGLAEPVISVDANDDPADTATGSNTAYPDPAAAYVTGWSASGSVLIFDASTYDAVTAKSANSDFSFTVYC